jgi:formylglycine-generating enzyme required for sulfatase activity
MMGGTKYPDELPVHRVEIGQDFWMQTTPVTNSQYLRFVGKTHYRGSHRNFLLHTRKEPLSPPWRNPDNPVVFVSWHDAREYCLWLSESSGLDFRLPTEAEWEYACRAGSRTVYPWGNEPDRSQANTDDAIGRPTPVGSFPPNAWGLFDMIGNVWEWCEDVKDVIPREESLFYRECAKRGISVDPLNSPSAPLVSERVAQGLQATRGGSFSSQLRNFRPANRRGQDSFEPGRAFGFRVVLKGEPPI